MKALFVKSFGGGKEETRSVSSFLPFGAMGCLTLDYPTKTDSNRSCFNCQEKHIFPNKSPNMYSNLSNFQKNKPSLCKFLKACANKTKYTLLHLGHQCTCIARGN